jgi:hypothetical protein
MDSALLVLAVIVAVAAVLIAGWAPGRDGHQLRLVRRFRSFRAQKSENFRDAGDNAPVRNPCNNRVGAAVLLPHVAATHYFVQGQGGRNGTR